MITLPPSLRDSVGHPDWRGKRVHLIGVGGTGMRGAARMLMQLGCHVSGSDMNDSPLLGELRQLGAEIHVGHRAANVPANTDLVARTAAVPETNPELQKAQRRGLCVLKYAQLLGRLMDAHDGIAVSGCHGKTTATSLTAYVLHQAGLDPSFVVGGEVPQLGGSAHAGRGRLFVAEACEYDRSFLNLNPKYGVITNIDRDHLDCYGNLEAIVEAFGQFSARVHDQGLMVVNGEDKNVAQAVKSARCPVATFGAGHAVDWRIRDLARVDGVTRFSLEHGGGIHGPFDIRFPGEHYVWNAAAVAILCHALGLSDDVIGAGLAGYSGARRRFERVGSVDGIDLIDDYGHHPREVRVTLAAARAEFPERRLWCVFQPHQYSRTRLLFEDFATAFGAVDRVILPEIYPVRDTARDRRLVSSADLAVRMRREGVHVEHLPTFPEVLEHLAANLRPGDVVITMGAGTVDEVGRDLLVRLRRTAVQGASLVHVGS